MIKNNLILEMFKVFRLKTMQEDMVLYFFKIITVRNRIYKLEIHLKIKIIKIIIDYMKSNLNL